MVAPFLLLVFTFFSFLSCVSTSKASIPANEAVVALVPPVLNNKPPVLTGNIQIDGRQLLVDGAPFVIKAICYSPVPKGKTAPKDAIFATPTKADLLAIEKDFQMMQEAGINTIRLYVPITNKDVLDLLVKYRLKMTVPVYNNAALTSLDDIKKTVTLLKNHPATLIWEVGNEWNYNTFYLCELSTSHISYTGSKDPFELLKNAVATVKAEDTTHPVSTILGDLPKEDDFWKKIPDTQIDLYGSNIYDGLTFGDRLTRWKKISNKPLYIGEFGATAFNSTINAEDCRSQAIALKSLLTEIQNNLSSKNPDKVLAGGSIFEWCDEWWKGGGSPSDHGGNGFYLIADKKTGCQLHSYPEDATKDINVPKASGPYPDQIFHEKWWGIVDINRNKRPAYNIVKEIYANSVSK